MIAVAAAIPSVVERRQARRLAVWNAAVWAIGNGLAGTTLITYLAKEIGAARLGLSIGLILAAPQVVGLLRLGAPAMIDRLAGRKPFCIGMFFIERLDAVGIAVGLLAGPAAVTAMVAGRARPAVVPLPRAAISGRRRAVVVAGRRGADADTRAILWPARTVERGRHGRRRHCRRRVRLGPCAVVSRRFP